MMSDSSWILVKRDVGTSDFTNGSENVFSRCFLTVSVSCGSSTGSRSMGYVFVSAAYQYKPFFFGFTESRLQFSARLCPPCHGCFISQVVASLCSGLAKQIGESAIHVHLDLRIGQKKNKGSKDSQEEASQSVHVS